MSVDKAAKPSAKARTAEELMVLRARVTLAKAALLERDAEIEAATLLAATANDNLMVLSDFIDKHPPSPMAIAKLIERVRSMERSTGASNAAKQKHAEARAWVRSEWETRGPVNSRGRLKKGEFREKYVKLVFGKFGVKISGRRIAEDWLKGLE